MPSQDNAYWRHQQMRWLKPDAARWIRPDAARFLKPGTKPEDVYPALLRKYSRDQPRVPAGNGRESGQWTNGGGSTGRPRVIIDTTNWDSGATDFADGAASDGTNPMGTIDFGDLNSETEAFSLFGITPRERELDGVQLAGDPPRGIGDNGGPPIEDPPEIPRKMPETTESRMSFVRQAASWLAHVGRYSPLGQAFLGAANQVQEIKRLTDIIRTANDPPQSVESARDRVTQPSEPGYHDHHIVGQHDQNIAQFGKARIDSYENKVRIPVLKHFDLSGWYSRSNADYGNHSPRDYLRGRSWEEQMEVGLKELRKRGIIK